MNFYYLLLALLFIFTSLHLSIRKKRAYKIKQQELLSKIEHFNTSYESLCSHYISTADIEKFKSTYSLLIAELRKSNKHSNEFDNIISLYDSIEKETDRKNRQYIEYIIANDEENILRIEGKPFDNQQAEAIISNEDKTLVIAGAGSGKTLTIVGKVKYLCNIERINPEEILLISFTTKSAEEMTDRIKKQLGMNIEAITFHKLGLRIITKAWGRMPEVFDNIPLFIQNLFEDKLLKSPNFVNNLATFFFYYLDIPDDITDFASLGELYEDEKSSTLETLQSQYEKEKFIQAVKNSKTKEKITLRNEYVKSKEETLIANYLFLHGIRYEYEKVYPYKNDDTTRKTYHPDFYLPDYDIYLEHFGITEDNRCPWLSEIEERKYVDSIQWKREFHKAHNTRLIETYSYYTSKGILLKMLEEKLVANGVKLSHVDFNEVFQTIYIDKSNKYFSEFMKLCCTFITLYKSNNLNTSVFDEMESAYSNNPFLHERTNIFLCIIRTILKEYDSFLRENNAVDFSDMINIASKNVIPDHTIPSYKYVIVDEYQDISASRYTLLKAVVDATAAKLLCVGDDWQSIYRFAGSDITLFIDFEKYFGKTKRLKIEKTYRNSQQLINEATNFVTKNPLQIKKDLKSDKSLDYPLVFWGYDKKPIFTLIQIIDKIISKFGADKSIMILGRNNSDLEMLTSSSYFSLYVKDKRETLRYLPSPHTTITFSTVHKSKGLEADNVILINFKNEKLGFPNQIANDPVLDFVIKKEDNYPFAEERRLFYVAITRTKNMTFVLTSNQTPSVFLKDFKQSKSCAFINIKSTSNLTSNLCPRCKTGYLYKVTHGKSSFVGCSNFPRCTFTMKEVDALLEPRRCPVCEGYLTKRHSKNKVPFIGCTNYPYCTYTEPLKKNEDPEIFVS